MAEELRLWAMDGAGGATLLTHAGQTASEELLERTLLNNPKMVDEDLAVVGRQITVPGGRLDLLGVNGDGRLVVFELKRGTLTRDAVGQIIDYASYLDNLGDDDLAHFIARNSGHHGAEKIDDFNAWYRQGFPDIEDFSSLRPVQITLVGLGVDPNANRMVRYLANGGMGISLLTFSGYHYNGQTLLARQVEVAAQETVVENSQVIHRPAMSRKERVIANVEEWRGRWADGCDLFHSVRDMFNRNLGNPTEGATRFRSAELDDYRLTYRVRMRGPFQWYSNVQFVPGNQVVEAYFFPLGVEKCLEQFIELEQALILSGAILEATLEQNRGVHGFGFGMKSPADLETHKDKLIAVTQAVRDAYEQAEPETGGGMDENGGC